MAPDVKAVCERCGAEVAAAALFCPMCGMARATREDDPLIGKVIGDRYLLRERLGQGGSGTIYLAEHITVKRKIAVKVLHHELSQDDLAVERFRREATTVAEIDNEHIVEVLDFGRTDDGRLFLAMELLEGETLGAALRRERQLPVDKVLDVLVQVGEALMEAHAMGYVHRDLRPANIFLARRRGREGFVKILDFGLAKLVEREGEAATTTLGMTFGDPCYMSPEQARGDPFDRRADIYALGCMAYEMLTGRPPFVGKKVFEVLTQHLESPVAPPSRLRPDVPLWLDALILRALSKRADERFITVYRLVEAVREGQATGKVMSDEAARSMPAVEPPPPAPRRRDTDVVDPLPPPPLVTKSTPPVPSASRRVSIPAQAGASSSWFDRGEDLSSGDLIPGSSTTLEPARSRRPLFIAAGVVAAGVAAIALVMILAGRRGDPRDGDGVAAAAPPDAAAAAVAPATPPVVDIPENAVAPAPPAEPRAEPAAPKPDPEPEPEPAKPRPKAKPAVAAKTAAPPPKPKPKAKPEPEEDEKLSTRTGPPVFDFRPKPDAPPAAALAPPPAETPPPAPSAPPAGDGQASFYVKLGNRALRDGDTATAAESFTKARAFDNTNADAIAGLGAVAMKQGQYADAAVHLEAASRLAPRSARIHTLRGQAYLASGRRAEAAAAFRKALDIDPDSRSALEGYDQASGGDEAEDPPGEEEDPE
jgi:serine/threonine protein kinase